MRRILLVLCCPLLLLTAAESGPVAALLAARQGGPPVPPATNAPDLATALATHDALTDALSAAGDPLVGWKLAFMTPETRAAWGLHAPAWGGLHASMQVIADGRIERAGYHRCLAEAEIAFVLARPVTALPGVAQLPELVASIHPALDLPDVRYGPGRPAGTELIADGCAAHRFVLGPGRAPTDLDLEEAELVLAIDGAEVGRNPGSAIHGSPWSALHGGLALLLAHGVEIPAGAIILSGAGIAPVAVDLAAPRAISCSIAGLGTVAVRIE